MKSDDYRVFLAEILRFYVPLAATSVLMMVTHSVVSGAIARTLSPTIALAAYSAAMSVGQVFESPCYALQRMCLTFTRGKRSYQKVGRVMAMVLGVLVFGLSLISWTPLSKVVFRGVLGISEQVYSFAVPSLRVFIVWPIASAIRAFYQTPIVLQKKTIWMTVNMCVRVTLMFIAASILPRVWPTGPVGATILMLGLSTEALLALVVTKGVLSPLKEEGPDESIPQFGQILRFTIPLSLGAVVQTLGRPVITAGLSRTLNPEVALAGYQVALSFAFIFSSLTFNIYHAVVIFVKDASSFKKMRIFSLSLGFLAFSALLLCSIPRTGTWIFGRVIGTAPETTKEALRTLLVFAFMPLMAANAEFYGGILTLKEHTVWVTCGKLTNVLVSSVCVISFANMFPQMGGAIGALAMVLGGLAEASVAYRMVLHFSDCREYFEKKVQVAETR